MDQAYRIGVNIPVGTEESFMDSVNAVMHPLYPGYDRCFCWWTVNGTWRPLEGSSPFQGRVGEIERSQETRIEFAVLAEDLEAVVSRIVEIHPYEEPAIDIIPIIPWKDVLTRTSGS
ncbi:MAG: divalent cation tolerance protein CutA [Thermoplasmata archaeon]|nr:divalent cation tolerance protein CutA [Thermoplasmata archaeon]